MKSRILLSSILLGCVLLSVGLANQPGSTWEPVGPPETEQLERELRHRMAGYDCAFWPRNERLKDGIPGRLLRKTYTDNIKKWLPRVLDASLTPAELDPNSWTGVRKLYFDRNFILGRFSSAKDPNTTIEFKGTCRKLGITIRSNRLCARPATDMTSEEIKEILTTALRFPADKADKIELKSKGERLAGVDVYYGRMYCEWTDSSSPFTSVRQWWSYIPFWYAQGMLFVSVTTVERGDRPSATMEERWPF